MIQVDNLRKNSAARSPSTASPSPIEKGQVLGFLGPNGAGKSTSMRMVTGLLPPHRGQRSKIGGISMLDDP